MKQCANDQCKNIIPGDAKHCPYCGQRQVVTRTPAQPFFLIGIIMLSLMFVLMVRELSSRSDLQKASVEPPVERNIQITTQAPISINRTTSAPRTPIPPTRTALQSTSTPVIPSPTKISTSTSCPRAPMTRISINNLVRVITTDNDRLVLRSVPEINDGTELQRLNRGTELKIFNGPVCVRDPATSIFYWFWEVRIKSTDTFGWVAEGDRSLYYLEVIR